MANNYLILLGFVFACIFCNKLDAQRPIYLNFVSHNETSDPLDYDGSASDYATMKALVKRVCDTIIAKEAKYNMQVDANFIFGAIRFDSAATSSNDLLEWANNSPYIDVDGHNHFQSSFGPTYNPYNYADLAYLLDSCGVSLTKNILGGVTWKTVGTVSENWTQYRVPKAGYTYQNFIWQADILWGAATPGHTDDFEAFGIWKPKGATPLTFGQHDATQHLTAIGGGCKSSIGYNIVPQTGQLRYSTNQVIANILDMADYVNSHAPQTNEFYTLNILTNFRDFPNIPNIADSLAKIIDGLKPYVNQGKIVWQTLAEKHNTWLAAHSNVNDYFMFKCESMVLGNLNLESKGFNFEIYPNPATQIIQLKLMNHLVETASFEIIDLLGRSYYKQTISALENSIDISELPKGYYRVLVRNDKTLMTKPFIKIE